ncbi:MAG: hypothetical protein ACRDZN_00145, partial [Acidimicrobiales bacterium]
VGTTRVPPSTLDCPAKNSRYSAVVAPTTGAFRAGTPVVLDEQLIVNAFTTLLRNMGSPVPDSA